MNEDETLVSTELQDTFSTQKLTGYSMDNDRNLRAHLTLNKIEICNYYSVFNLKLGTTEKKNLVTNI